MWDSIRIGMREYLVALRHEIFMKLLGAHGQADAHALVTERWQATSSFGEWTRIGNDECRLIAHEAPKIRPAVGLTEVNILVDEGGGARGVTQISKGQQ